MDKEKLLAALNTIQDGEAAGRFHDELETLITIVLNAPEKTIEDAWQDFITDDYKMESPEEAQS